MHVFSRFTPEALLFEALAIFVLGAAYAAFWVLRKRRFGVAGTDVPSPVVRAYLGELIGDAQQIRSQLFGMIRGGVSSEPTLGAAPAQAYAASSGMDGSALEKIAALEARMAEQANAYESLTGEKRRIEQELAAARSSGGSESSAGASGGDSGLVDELKSKISTLEGKLSEYSVIEDDLANLKRLQQENAQLKAQLAGKPAPAAAPEPQAPAPVAAPVAAAPAIVEDDPLAALNLDAAAAPAPQAEAASDPLAALGEQPSVPDPLADLGGFDGLNAPVEQSLQSAPSSDAPAASAPPGEKSDADLVAEFEKMLNG